MTEIKLGSYADAEVAFHTGKGAKPIILKPKSMICFNIDCHVVLFNAQKRDLSPNGHNFASKSSLKYIRVKAKNRTLALLL